MITVVDAAKGIERRLVEDGSALRLWESDRRSFIGSPADRPFTVMAAMTREYDEALNGLHIAFSHRFIIKVDALGGRRLPHLFYGEVQFGDEWKDCLSSDKSEIARHHDELMEAIARLLGDWINILAAARVSVSAYNLPRCILEPSVWPSAAQSRQWPLRRSGIEKPGLRTSLTPLHDPQTVNTRQTGCDRWRRRGIRLAARVAASQGTEVAEILVAMPQGDVEFEWLEARACAIRASDVPQNAGGTSVVGRRAGLGRPASFRQAADNFRLHGGDIQHVGKRVAAVGARETGQLSSQLGDVRGGDGNRTAFRLLLVAGDRRHVSLTSATGLARPHWRTQIELHAITKKDRSRGIPEFFLLVRHQYLWVSNKFIPRVRTRAVSARRRNGPHLGTAIGSPGKPPRR